MRYTPTGPRMFSPLWMTDLKPLLDLDSDIIASLGSVDSYNGEQKGRFIDGLRKVLSDLKSEPKRVNFDSITSAILQYRKEFFGGDETKVLPLEGVAI